MPISQIQCQKHKDFYLAFVEHENTIGNGGLVPSIRKLMDYRSDVLRIVVGYSRDPEKDCASEHWTNLMNQPPVESLDSIVVAVGALQDRAVRKWVVRHFVGGRLQPIA